jgi:hypothetical protein
VTNRNRCTLQEYPDATDEIREVLIHGSYLSRRDIDICLGSDLSSLLEEPESAGVRDLQAALLADFGQDGES